ncbi:MAG: GNAT family N-acetyltransferase [Sulfuricurvum sp.]|nr:GNAT family N-acetyltransferase [Sulfuricurvum sp.]
MKFEWITDWETIWSDDFVKRWQTWMEESQNAHVFFHPAMVKAWVDTYLPLRDIRPMFCIATQGQTTIFLPLVLWRKNWKNAFVRTIIPVGYSDFDYHTPIVRSDGSTIDWNEFWINLYDEIQHRWKGKFDLVEIDGIKKAFTGNTEKWQLSDECPYIDLRPYNSYEAFLGYFKSKQRNDIQRQIRRLEEEGTFAFEVLESDRKSEILALLPTILHHHALRWPNAYKAPNYHYNLLSNALEHNLLHFSQITINGKAICWNISFVYNKTYYFYMPIYIEKYANFSPGKLNMFLCISDIISKRYEKFDLLRGAEEYKNKLPILDDAVFQYIEKNNGFLSRIKESLLLIRKRLA